MTADEIRKSIEKGGRFEKIMYTGSFGAAPFLLAEIAAQLAELNSTLRVQSAILAGEGSPQ